MDPICQVGRLQHEVDDLSAVRLDDALDAQAHTSALGKAKEELAAVQAALEEEKRAGEEGRREAAKELAGE